MNVDKLIEDILGKWIEYNNIGGERPIPNQEYAVKTQYGERKAIFCPQNRGMLIWAATDCSHPMQNVNLNNCVTHFKIITNQT